MKRPEWFERQFAFGMPSEMLPFFLERLEGTIARLEKRFENLSDHTASFRPDGKWSIKQHVGHLAEVDEIALKRIDEMLKGISPMAPAVFEPRRDYNSESVVTVLNYFVNNRLKNLHRYRTLSDAELKKASLHPRLKVMMTPVDLAYFDAEHDDHHLLKIRDNIAYSG